jgi:glycosyltransferase involved in cell wall biosynthesis
MAACWQALAEIRKVDFSVLAFAPGAEAPFGPEILQGLPVRLLDEREREDGDLIEQLVIEQQPDVVALPGWMHEPYRRLVASDALTKCQFVMAMDTPWRGVMRQQLAPYLLRSFLRRMDRVVVTGERSWQYARKLRISPDKIVRGTYGIDYTRLAPLWDARYRLPGGWPRRFLFVGRYEHDKGIDVLLDAYRLYSTAVSDPWPLTCCGSGSLDELVSNARGVENLGFLQPADLLPVFAGSGVFVIASRFDPWPLVIVESSAAGLPVIASEACGSAVELIRPHYNGLMVPTDDVRALAAAMVHLHDAVDELAVMGRRGQELAAPYSAEIWARRWSQMVKSL